MSLNHIYIAHYCFDPQFLVSKLKTQNFTSNMLLNTVWTYTDHIHGHLTSFPSKLKPSKASKVSKMVSSASIQQEIYLLVPKYVLQVFGGPIIKIVLEMTLNNIYIAHYCFDPQFLVSKLKILPRTCYAILSRPILITYMGI